MAWVNKGFRNCENRRFFSQISPSLHERRVVLQWGANAAPERPFEGVCWGAKSAMNSEMKKKVPDGL